MTNILLLFEKLIKDAGIGALGTAVVVAGTMAGSIAIASAQAESVVQGEAIQYSAVPGIAVSYNTEADNTNIDKEQLAECLSKVLCVSEERKNAPRTFNELYKLCTGMDLLIPQAEEVTAEENEVVDVEELIAEEEVVVMSATVETCISETTVIVEEYSMVTNEDSIDRGNELVEYAVQFVGNPYVWGGTSLTDGADCSGFTMTLYGMYGIELPHSSLSQAGYGTAVDGIENAIPGDLMVYNGHVAVYMGNGQIVHAANSRLGICITGIDFMDLVGIRRLL